MRPPGLAALVLAGALVAPASAAHGDSLVAAAPGTRNLAAGGGYMAWAAPSSGGRWRLTVRDPNGAVTTPPIPSFAVPPDPSIGNDSPSYPSRGLLAVYARCAGASSVTGCDIYAYDLRAGAERKMTALSSPKTSETAPSLSRGAFTFVRRDGARPGVYVSTPRGGVRRLTLTVAVETAANQTRVAYSFRTKAGWSVATRRFSGEGGELVLTAGQASAPRSIVFTRYKAGWLQPAADGSGQEVHWSSRISGHSLTGLPIRIGRPALPPSADSIATGSLIGSGTIHPVGEPSRVTDYLDAEGVKHIVPELKF